MAPGDGGGDPGDLATQRLDGEAVGARGGGVAYARGATVGRYVVLEPLGSGGMGTVFVAYDPQLERRVALKVLRIDETRPEDRAQHRDSLLREAHALAQLSHPNVVAVHDVGTIDDKVFLTLELVRGVTLRTWLREKPRKVRDIVAVFSAAGEGLAAAHRTGIVHRDFKPENVVVGNDERVRVLDFGLAYASFTEAVEDAPAEDRASLGGPGARDAPVRNEGPSLIAGTPAYMAPEQHEGRRPDARADQWSFCVALHEALYGTRPFAGTHRDELQAAIRARRLAPVPRSARVPPRLRRILLRGLASSPDERYPSLPALLAELRNDPWQRARTWGLALAGVGLLLSGIGIQSARASREQALCRGGVDEVHGVWNDAMRAQVQRAFADTGVPSADEASRIASATLDAYGKAWAGTHQGACEATRSRGLQSEELLDLRMQCLSARLVEMKTLVDIFGRASADVVRRAPRAAQQLSPIEQCSDVEALKAPVKPPADPAVRARVAEIRSQVARARAMLVTGKFEEGWAIAEPAVAAAIATGYRAVEAEALLTATQFADRRGEYERCNQLVRRCIVAAEASRHDDVRAQAYASLIWLVGERLARPREGLEWAELAEATAERLGSKGSELTLAALLRSRAVLLYRMGRYEEALATSQKALTLREDHAGEGDADVGECISDIGISLFLLGRYGEARTYAKKALVFWEKALGPNHVDVASALDNLGEVERAEGHYEEALADYERALAIWENGHDVARAVALANIADVYKEQGRYGEARSRYERATAIWRSSMGQGYVLTAYSMTGEADVLRLEGHLDAALSRYQEALALRERVLGKEHPDLASDLLGIGEVYLARKQPERALVPLEEALTLREKNPGSRLELGDARSAVARALRAAHLDGRRADDLTARARADYEAEGPRGRTAIARLAAKGM